MENTGADVTYNFGNIQYTTNSINYSSPSSGNRYATVDIVTKNNSYTGGYSPSPSSYHVVCSNTNTYDANIFASSSQNVTLGVGGAKVFSVVFEIPSTVTVEYVTHNTTYGYTVGYDSTLAMQNSNAPLQPLSENKNAQVTYNFGNIQYTTNSINYYSPSSGNKFATVQVVTKNNSYASGYGPYSSSFHVVCSDGNTYDANIFASSSQNVTLGVGGAKVFSVVFEIPSTLTVEYVTHCTTYGYTVGYDSTLALQNSDGSGVQPPSPDNNKAQVIYKVDGTAVFTDRFNYGTEVTVRSTYVKTGYTVTTWSTTDVNVTDGKFIIGQNDVTFTATSEMEVNKDDSGKYVIKVDNRASFSSCDMTSIINSAKSDSNVTMTVTIGKSNIVFDNMALLSIGDTDEDLSLNETIAPQSVKDKIGSHPVFEISFGSNKNFGDGHLTITVPYILASGENADNLVIYHISNGKITETLDCTYNNGYVTFTTNHLSMYALGYDSGPSSFPIAFVVIGAIAVLGVGAAVFFLIRRHS